MKLTLITSLLSDDPYYNSLNDFVYDLDKNIPKVYDQSTYGYYLDCNTLVWVRNIGRVNGCDDPVRDVSVLTMQRKGRKIQAKDGLFEFDSIKWGKALGGKYDPPKQQYNYGQNKGDGHGGKKNDDTKSSPNQNGSNDYEWDPKENDSHQTSPHKNQHDPKKTDGNGYDGNKSDPTTRNGYDDKKNGGTQVNPHKNDGNGYDGKQTDPKTGGTQVDPQINNNGYSDDSKNSGTQVDPHQQNGYKDDDKLSGPQNNDKDGHNDDKKGY
ncbi:uncharacterized protein MYCFIDRAFT_85496 [Pseudocercospora fijiensis CIRAD86]|uniref:NTF2-like domain-containing protein n=1 Tax=Pseudocercospora fijiensis (strain CIRAD86) TaxID=383855 RepID=M3B2N2_PSEFD|nr:uncharacterized protein MYCFIDRAFT_85496 [Pseudocercospora fijiensis CIRAD86]EME83652.1 hypothetical protein MYCFIDRAFT_85496 [Pseudocercospora fijiensis CIRAD86]